MWLSRRSLYSTRTKRLKWTNSDPAKGVPLSKRTEMHDGVFRVYRCESRQSKKATQFQPQNQHPQFKTPRSEILSLRM